MELREGYKQTEIGVIPEDWDAPQLKEYVEINSGESPSKHNFISDGIPYYKVDQLNVGAKYTGATPYKIKSEKTVSAGSVIFPKRGASILLNKIRILKENSFMDTNLMTLTVKNGLFNEYLFYCLDYQGLSKVADTTSIPQINNKHIDPFRIPLPPTKTEQTAIANALSDADAWIQPLTRLIAKKRQIKQGAMQTLLNPYENGNLKAGWVVKKLGEVAEITAGGDLRVNEFSKVESDQYSYPIYSNAHTQKGLYGFCKTSDYTCKAVTITARGGIGYAVSRDNAFCAIGRLLILQPYNEYSCEYISEYINLKIEFANESTGVPQLTAPQVSKYEIFFPSSTEQSRVASIFSDMDTEIATLETKLKKAQQIKQGMMQNLLTGRIRLVPPQKASH